MVSVSPPPPSSSLAVSSSLLIFRVLVFFLVCFFWGRGGGAGFTREGGTSGPMWTGCRQVGICTEGSSLPKKLYAWRGCDENTRQFNSCIVKNTYQFIYQFNFLYHRNFDLYRKWQILTYLYICTNINIFQLNLNVPYT